MAKKNWLKALWVLGAVIALGCGVSTPDPTPDPDPDPDPQPEVVDPVQQDVGVAGATLQLSNGAALSIPAEALDANVQLTMAVAETEAPAELKAASPVYEFGPSGTVFARPVTVRFPVTGTVTNPTIYWSKAAGEGYEAIGGKLVDGVMVAEVLHFSSGFVGEGTGTRTVSGVDVVTWATENGIDNVPNDLSGRGIVALVEDEDGTFTEIAGVGRADGTFTIEGVPEGRFYVKNGTNYLVTDQSVLDLGRSRLGRPNAALATADTILNLQATNLAPWQDGDRIQLFSTNSNSWYFDMQDYVPHPAVGETTLDTSLNTRLWNTNLIDGAQGDRAILAQLSLFQSDTGVPYTAVNRVLTYDAFTQVDGGTAVTVSGAMQPVASDHEISLDWKLTQYEAFGAASVPAVGTIWRSLAVMGHPGGTSRGFYSNAADFLIVSPESGEDLVTGKMTYGMPLSGTWGQSVLARVQFPYLYQLDGASSAYRDWGTIETLATIDEATAGPLVPTVSPVRNIQVNDAAATALVSNVPARPVVSWEAPEVGTADMYQVQVNRLFIDTAGATRRQTVGSIRTQDTQVRVPTELMIPGEKYALKIFAIQSEATTAAKPSRLTTPEASASALTAVIEMAP